MKLVSRAKLPEEEYDKMIVKHWKVLKEYFDKVSTIVDGYNREHYRVESAPSFMIKWHNNLVQVQFRLNEKGDYVDLLDVTRSGSFIQVARVTIDEIIKIGNGQDTKNEGAADTTPSTKESSDKGTDTDAEVKEPEKKPVTRRRRRTTSSSTKSKSKTETK